MWHPRTDIRNKIVSVTPGLPLHLVFADGKEFDYTPGPSPYPDYLHIPDHLRWETAVVEDGKLLVMDDGGWLGDGRRKYDCRHWVDNEFSVQYGAFWDAWRIADKEPQDRLVSWNPIPDRKDAIIVWFADKKSFEMHSKCMLEEIPKGEDVDMDSVYFDLDFSDVTIRDGDIYLPNDIQIFGSSVRFAVDEIARNECLKRLAEFTTSDLF